MDIWVRGFLHLRIFVVRALGLLALGLGGAGWSADSMDMTRLCHAPGAGPAAVVGCRDGAYCVCSSRKRASLAAYRSWSVRLTALSSAMASFFFVRSI